MREIWRKIKAFPDYEISNFGRVKSHNYYRKNVSMILVPIPALSGHLRVCLYKNRKQKIVSVHRLVLIAFKGDCPNKMQACHNAGNPANNHIDNLRWDTIKNNHADKIKHGTHQEGETSPTSKLKNAEVLEIRRLKQNGIRQNKIAKMFKVTPKNIEAITTRKTWKHLTMETEHA